MSTDLIHRIVEQRDLEIHFMPIVRFSCDGGVSRWSLFAFEALIRGPRESPLRRPDALFPEAERVGLRDRLELMCLEAAFEKMPELSERALLFLNIGVGTFLTPGFEEVIERWYERLDPSRIVFEIVEGAVPSVSRFRRQMERGMLQGFRYALDDLPADGEAMRRMVEAGPVAFLKIDRGFAKRWKEAPRATRDWLGFVSDMAQATGAELVLEGVEPHMLEALPELWGLGVKLGQGFLFGEPAILAPGFVSWRRGFHGERSTIGMPERRLEVLPDSSANRWRTLVPAWMRPAPR